MGILFKDKKYLSIKIVLAMNYFVKFLPIFFDSIKFPI